MSRVDEKRDAILRELPEDFVRVMRNWVRSRTGNGYAISAIYQDVQDSSGYAVSSVPVLVGEATDVDQALDKIPKREALAVRLFWELEGASLRQLGRRLHINHETVAERVRRGHRQLREQLDGMRQARHRMHAEIVAMGAGA